MSYKNLTLKQIRGRVKKWHYISTGRFLRSVDGFSGCSDNIKLDIEVEDNAIIFEMVLAGSIEVITRFFDIIKKDFDGGIWVAYKKLVESNIHEAIEDFKAFMDISSEDVIEINNRDIEHCSNITIKVKYSNKQ